MVKEYGNKNNKSKPKISKILVLIPDMHKFDLNKIKLTISGYDTQILRLS